MKTTRGKKADATRRQLLNAALAVIGEKGYSEATVDEIVETAGVSKGVAYYHFKNKAAMAQSILEQGIGELVDTFEEAANESSSASEALIGILDQFATFIFENTDFARFFVSELWREGRSWSDSMRTYERRLMDVLQEQLRRGQGEGSIRAEIDPVFESAALIGMVLTSTMYFLIGADSVLGGIDAAVSDEKSLESAGRRELTSEEAAAAKAEFVNCVRDFVKHANAPVATL